MKGTGKLSGAVMQIAFILIALHFQSLISAPAMTSLCYFLSPLFYPFPHLPHLFLFSSFSCYFWKKFISHFLLPSDSPYSFPSLAYSLPVYPSQSQSQEFLLHLFACGKKKKKKGKWEHIGGECEWLRSLPLNSHSRGSRLENMTGVGSASEVLDGFWRAP